MRPGSLEAIIKATKKFMTRTTARQESSANTGSVAEDDDDVRACLVDYSDSE